MEKKSIKPAGKKPEANAANNLPETPIVSQVAATTAPDESKVIRGGVNGLVITPSGKTVASVPAFKIRENKPVPVVTKSRKLKYPFAELKPGNSFFVPAGKLPILQGAANRAGKILGRKFIVSVDADEIDGVMKDGVAVWRVIEGEGTADLPLAGV